MSPISRLCQLGDRMNLKVVAYQAHQDDHSYVTCVICLHQMSAPVIAVVCGLPVLYHLA